MVEWHQLGELVWGDSLMSHAFSPAYSAAFDIATPGQHGGWQKLLDIKRQDEQEYENWLMEIPSACPNDGTPLDVGPQGMLHCPMGDWTRPAGWTNERG